MKPPGARREARWTPAAALALAAVTAVYLFKLGDVPLIKVDDFWGGQSSWEVWKSGRFALPAFAGHLGQETRTFFHPPGFYLVNALIVGPLGPSTWSLRLGPTLFALLSFVVLHSALRRKLSAAPHATALALAGAALAALNPLTFALARHARPETWVLFLGVSAAALARPAPLAAWVSGLLGGLAVFSHFWGACIPGLIGLHFACRREWRALAWHLLGVAVFASLTAAWVLSNWSDFAAFTNWYRGHALAGTPLQYLEDRLRGMGHLLTDERTASVWIVEALLLLLLAFPGAGLVRWRMLGLLGCLHLFLLLFPVQNPYYQLAVAYFAAAAVPIVLARLAVADASCGPARRALPAGAIACVLLILAGGLGHLFWRDRGASYHDTFQPLRAAVEREDPQGRAFTVGSEIHYLAFWDRQFLVRGNDSLWRDGAGAGEAAEPEAITRRWRTRGIRFVITSSLMPEEARLSPLAAPIDRAFIAHLRSAGRVLATVETYFYGEPEHKYRWARVEVIDIGPPP